MFYKVLSSIAVLAALLSATPSYDIASIRRLAASDYEEAMRLAEEGMRKGQLSAFEAYELKSNITYQYTENYQEAASWLRKALEQDEAQAPAVRTELLYHMATIQKAARDYTSCLATCAEGKEIAHAIGHRYEEHSFDFLAGSCLFSIGEDESGLAMMRDAIAGASSVASGEAEYGHLVFFTGSLVNCYIEIKDYSGALEECAVNDALLARMEKNFPGLSPEYIDRSRFYSDLNKAICYAGTGQSGRAEENLLKALECGYASTAGGKFHLADYYSAAGEPENVLRIYAELPYADADTVSRGYRLRLARLRDAYANAGMAKEAESIGERYDAISAQLEERENAAGVRVKAAQYDTQQYRLALGDSLAGMKKYRRGITLLILLIVASFVVFVLLNNLMRSRKDAQHRKETASLEKDLRSLQRQVSLIAERDMRNAGPAEENKELSFTELIEGRKLYLNKNLNRESAASLLGVSQAEISKMLSAIGPGLSFPDYIKGLRTRHALQLLGENPDIPIAELADRCGFYTTRTLQRSFLAIVGKTPSEYAKELKAK